MGDVIQLFTEKSKTYQDLKSSISNEESDPARAERLIKVIDEIETIQKNMNTNPPKFEIELPAESAKEIETIFNSLKKHYSGIIFDLMDIVLAEKIKNIDK